MLEPYVKPGVSTDELNRICHEYIVGTLDCIPAPLPYGGCGGRPPFPKSICTSVNHVVCHGIPGPTVLKQRDVVNGDIPVIQEALHGHTSRMDSVGKPNILTPHGKN